jgi:hypothetical protein
MKCNTTIRCLFPLIWALLTLPVGAMPTPLQAGRTLTIDCANGNILTRRTTTATGSQTVAARLTMSLDSTGTVLTINFQNTATLPDAMLYAIDLGLPTKFVAVNRMEARFSDLPAGGRWHGPTDLAGATNAIGASTLAAREVIAGRMEDYLPRQRSLSAGFLRSGQGGKITIKLTLTAAARQKPLLLDPVAYFLVNDPNAPNKRMQIVSTSTARAN